MPLSDWIKIAGSNKPPTATSNRYADPIMTADRRLAVNTLNALRTDIPNAYRTYMAGQGRQEALAADQESTLRTLLGRRMDDDPNQNLRDIFNTAFSQIDPNVVSPLARFDVNQNRLYRMASGMSPGAIDSTAERLRNARIASGRYYDVARNVYNVVPQLFNSAYAQGQANDAAIGGFIPQIAAGYEAVANRPTQGIMNRINAVRAGQGISSQGIQNALAGTQGYQTHQNWADKVGGALAADEKAAMDIAKMALSLYSGGALGGMGGGGGGGLGSIFGGMGGGGGQPSGTPAYGSMYQGSGGLYQSIPNAQGGGYSQPRF